MALVGSIRSVLGNPEDLPANSLIRAARPGRVRAVGERLYREVMARPASAGSIMRKEFREARFLHSWERRLVGDGVYALLRHHCLMAAMLGSDRLALDDQARAHWLAWLVLRGLPASLAQKEVADLPFERVEALSVSDPGTEAKRLALLGSLAPFAARRLLATFEYAGALSFLAASNLRAPTVIRVNLLHIQAEELRRLLAEEGIPARPTLLAEHGLVVEGSHNLVGTRAFQRGLFEVQDEGSQLVGQIIQPTGLVVDYCAGAGGKTLDMASRMGRQGELVAFDARQSALSELRRRAKKAAASVRVGVAARSLAGQADRVLVDAPCSGSGVLRRRPQNRWRMTRAELSRLEVQQLEILDEAAPLVKVRGRLIYATCSVLPEENEELVGRFLAKQGAFSLLPLTSVLGAQRATAVGDGSVLRVAPHTHGTDGFFGVVLERKER